MLYSSILKVVRDLVFLSGPIKKSINSLTSKIMISNSVKFNIKSLINES